MFNAYDNTLPYNDLNKDDSAVLMTPPELAAYLGIGRNMAYQLLNEGTKSRTTSPAGGLLLALLGQCYFSA